MRGDSGFKSDLTLDQSGAGQILEHMSNSWPAGPNPARHLIFCGPDLNMHVVVLNRSLLFRVGTDVYCMGEMVKFKSVFSL